MTHLQRQSGMTLIEILITVLILAIGLLGLSGLQSTSIKAGLDVAQRSQARWLANDLADRLRANPYAYTDYISINTAACAAPPVNCSDHAGALGQACSPLETAQFDVWEVACGQTPASAGVLTNSVDTIDVTAINVSCEGGPCAVVSKASNTQNVYLINVVYNSRLVNGSKALAANQTATAQQSQTLSIRVVPTYAAPLQ